MAEESGYRERDTIFSQDGISPALLTSNLSNQRRYCVKLKFVGGLGKPRVNNGELSREWSEGNRIYSEEGLCPTLSSNSGQASGGSQLMSTNMRVRRLTPTECERLMSWEDGRTKYGQDESGKVYELSDSRRYKCIGNGIVSSVSKKIIEETITPGRIFSICSGVDGSCLALDKTKYPVVGFCEFDKYPSDVLRYHYPHIKNWGDLTKLPFNDLPDFEILFSSVSCQSFSQAGKKLGLEDTRGTLFYYMAKILHVKNPKYFIFENVPGLLSHDKGRTFEIMLEVLCGAGYAVDFELVNAKYFGVAQNRQRLFMVGMRLDNHDSSIL